MSTRFAIAFTIALLPAAALVPFGCSSPASHPPLVGDCSGKLCPPLQNQGASGSSGSGDDGSTDGTTPVDATSDSGSDAGDAAD